MKERKDRPCVGKRRARPDLRRNAGKLRRTGQLGKRTGVNIKVATVNVRGLAEIGKRMIIEQWAEKHCIDVVCVTETHHPHSSVESVPDGMYVEEEKIRGDWKWFFSSGVDPKDLEKLEKTKKTGGRATAAIREQAREYHGVATMVHKRWWHNITDARPAGSRAMVLELKTKPRLKFLAAYAPHALRPTEEKEQFYENLIVLFNEKTKGGMTIIGGDFNARLGYPIEGGEEEIIGRHGYAEKELRNETEAVQESREMLLQFCKMHKMAVANTRFEHK